jgi:hypothetical protein
VELLSNWSFRVRYRNRVIRYLISFPRCHEILIYIKY